MFKGFSASVIGAAHITGGMVCQDYSGHFCNDEFAVAAVSDGHGSQKHFRSEIGSKIAVEISLEAVKEFWQEKDIISKHWQEREKEDTPHIAALKQLERNLIARWRIAVADDFNKSPLTEEEIEICAASGIDMDNIKPELFYGATLIIGMLCEQFAFALKIGDGACVMINKNNEPIIHSELEDERLGFGITSSLCDSVAIENFRHFYTEDVPLAIILSTDGITDSYASMDFLSFNAKIFNSLQMDFESASRDLIDWLPTLSEKGSRDDMSISAVFIAHKSESDNELRD